MTTDADIQRAIHEAVEIVPYDCRWSTEFETERSHLLQTFPESFSDIEHVGITAVPGLAAKPIIDLIAVVPSMDTADMVMHGLVPAGYLFPADFNAKLEPVMNFRGSNKFQVGCAA